MPPCTTGYLRKSEAYPRYSSQRPNVEYQCGLPCSKAFSRAVRPQGPRLSAERCPSWLRNLVLQRASVMALRADWKMFHAAATAARGCCSKTLSSPEALKPLSLQPSLSCFRAGLSLVGFGVPESRPPRPWQEQPGPGLWA